MTKRILYGTLGYFILTFALGVTWHFVFFKDVYHSLGAYNREQPIFLFGIVAILGQGMILSYLFQFFYRGAAPIKEGLVFSWLMGLFMYTLTTIAFAAKTEVSSLPMWLAIQAAFHFFQFTVTGVLLGIIFGRSASARLASYRIPGI